MELLTSRLKLREFWEEDYAALREMDLRPEMHTYERAMPSEAGTREALAGYLSSQLEQPRSVFRLAITVPPGEAVVGMVKFSQQWEAIREWEVGWAVSSAQWGQGYATEAAREMIGWGFRNLNVHRVVAFCHSLNRASVRVMQKLGMHQDGILRETRWLNGAWWDECVYSVLEREWGGR